MDSLDTFNHHYPFQTKCGWPARLLGVVNRSAYPLAVAVHNPAFNAEEVHCYAMDGRQPMARVYASGQVPDFGDGALDGALSLVNIPAWTDKEDGDGGLQYYLESTDFVHAVATHDLPPMDVKVSSNPFHYDATSMGTDLVRGWMVMHDGYDRIESPRPLTSVCLVNTRSGQRIQVSLATKVFKLLSK